MRLLVIEDNRDLVANLFAYFESRGHVLDAAPDGITGLHLALTQPYDAVVLDWMLPRMDGPQVLRKLREEGHSDMPVVMLTARDELPDKLAGFRAGADDYLTKPFGIREFVAQAIHLFPAGRKLLEALMRASPAVVTREQLERTLWGDEPPDGDMLRSHVYELRREVDGPFPVKLIQTVPRTGYRLARVATPAGP